MTAAEAPESSSGADAYPESDSPPEEFGKSTEGSTSRRDSRAEAESSESRERTSGTASCSFLTLPIFMGGPMSNFYLAVAAAIIATVLGFIITWIIGFDEEKGE